MENKEKKGAFNSLTGMIIRFVVTSIILAITSFLTPGFVLVGLRSIILAAVVISLIDYLVEKLMRVDASPFGKGIKGFVIAAIILYIAQFLVPGMRVSMIGAIFASIVIGILDAILPGRAI
ncbi:phage holin family protein [Clostridium sp. CM028]|uniref:phage holin family protein n=1 Tax=Clostridium TaxID=1485 RepID=UPI0013EEE07A|nr:MULTISPECIES: phage holin family protein [Clostridium]MBU3091637.1 phage holin family protein [Clostridium sp. CF011]MBW9144098.1 phage holin family protein [Clostridium sp. CM027]MBW9147591.1 phage holin family protein [Clostridium sp. CM028]MBZ9608306.1 phage holin family protein [Clostridium estertheticum]UVE41256.1 phage holin family protein [Clostridium sp. CM027]